MSELKHVYHRSALFKKAWGIARHNAKHAGERVSLHFAAALKQAWAFAKLNAKLMAESNARVLEAIERIKALHTPEAAAARAADMAAFAKRFPRRPGGRAYRRAA